MYPGAEEQQYQLREDGLRGPSPQPPPPNPQKIIILRALYLGDLLLATPAWRALRRRFPAAEITLVGLPWAEQFLPHAPGLIDRLLAFPGYPGLPELPYSPERTAAFLAAQRAYGYDLAIQMHGDGRASNAFVAALGARASLGLAHSDDSPLDIALPYQPTSPPPSPQPPAPSEENELLRWLRLVAAIGARAESTQISFQVGPQSQARAAELLRGAAGPLVGLHVGAKDPARRWPPARFAELGSELRRLAGATPVLTGTSDEHSLTALAARQIGPPLIDLAGRTTLGDLAALIARLDLLVTNDTGASHLAAAVGTPSVVLFGPTRPARYAPLDRDLHRPIDALEHLPAADGAAALAALPVEPVLAAALGQLAQGGRQREVK